VPGGRGDPRDRPGPADWGSAAGWTVPGYTHVRELGAGRAGWVVLAVDDVTQTPVAIKYLRDDAEFRYRRNASAGPLSRLEDPNLVQVYEYAESPDGDGAAIVTEYVEGISLRRLLAARRGLDPEAALSVLGDSLLALAALHGAGLAHGAYKPENVLIAADGTAKLGDAGIGDAPPYWAPEQEESPAADLFAATTVFVECLPGARAVPDQFRAIVTAGLAPDPSRRPPSAAAFLTELDEAATGVFGSSWERTGRARLAGHAAEAADIVDAAAGTVGGPHVPHPREPEPEPRPGPSPKPHATGSAGPERGRPPRREKAPFERAVYQPTPFDTGPFEPVPYDAGPYDAGSYDPSPYDPSPFDTGSFEPVQADTGSFERTPHPPGPYARGSYEAGLYEAAPPDPRRSPPRSRTGVRIAIGASAAMILVIGAGWYALANRSSSHRTANAQATSPTPGTERPRPPTRPGELARAISKAVSARRTATFTYRAAGVAAQGTLKFAAGSATAYDMNLTPLAGAHPDPRHPVSRVILFGNRAYVARGGWKSYPLTTAERRGEPGRLYVSLAASTRESSSVYDILALLRSSAKVRRAGLTYRGVANLARLAHERTVAELYAPAPRGAVVGYTLDMAQNLLPRQLTVTIKTPGGRQRIFRTTYTGWGHGPPIVPPH
jgi:tRNA A-37 threonylcarbamoyl transferase component Bud32